MRSPIALLALPVMRAWVAQLREHTLSVPRPTDEPRVHAQGVDPDRILLIGSGPAVGWGVLSYELSLGGVLARAVTLSTGRGVDVDIVTRAGMTAESALGILEGLKLWRYDAVVLCLGLNESIDITALEKWRRNCAAVLDLISERAAMTTEVFVLGVPAVATLPGKFGFFSRVAQRHANKLDTVMQQCCESRDRVTFFPLTSDKLPPLTEVPHRAEYEAWGTDLGGRMASVLQCRRQNEHRDSRLEVGFESEADRQAAVDSLADTLAASPERMQRAVALASELFDTEIAMFTVIDGETQRHIARVGLGDTEVPRTSSFCAHTIQQRGAMVVPDAREDARFDQNPLVLGEPRIRFYAGYPIESPSGEPIGALCIIDSQPRPASHVDEALLRKIALLIQGELVAPERRSLSSVP